MMSVSETWKLELGEVKAQAGSYTAKARIQTNVCQHTPMGACAHTHMDNECTKLTLTKLKLWYNTKEENLLWCALVHVSLCSKARKASKLHWLETRSPVLLHKDTSRTTSARCPIKFLWHLDHTGDTEWGAWIQKQGKKCSGQVFKCSPTCDSILTDNHQGATSTGLWRPEIGLDYLSISLLESNLYMILFKNWWWYSQGVWQKELLWGMR